VAVISCSPLVSRNSMHREGSRTSLQGAKTAVPQRRTRRRVREKCSQLYAQNAVRSARCPSSLPKAKLYIAASASQLRERSKHSIGRASYASCISVTIAYSAKVKSCKICRIFLFLFLKPIYK